MSRSRKAVAPTMWDQAEEVPRAGIPSTDRLNRRMRWNRRFIWAVLAAFPLMGGGLIVTAASLKAAGVEEAPAAVVDPGARAVAISAVTSWLGGVPAPLPGGRLVSWDTAALLPAFVPTSADTKEDVAAAATLNTHELTVQDGTGALFAVQVLVASNRLGEMSVVGLPSLLPLPPASDWAAGASAWPNLAQTTADAPVLSAVDAWVEAFTSGDPAKLRLTVGDPDTEHAYMPMSGVLSATGESSTAGWVLDEAGEQTSTMIVQVDVQFTWPGADPLKAGPKAAGYDLLVTGADSGAPRVVAWGGAGTGPVLTEFGNAIVGRSLEAAQPLAADTTTTTTEVTSTTVTADTQAGQG